MTKFWKTLLLILVVLSAANTTFNIIGWFDRAEIKRSFQMSREMLDARAEIQIIFFQSGIENRKLTQEEIDKVNKLWVAAEYDKVEQK